MNKVICFAQHTDLLTITGQTVVVAVPQNLRLPMVFTQNEDHVLKRYRRGNDQRAERSDSKAITR